MILLTVIGPLESICDINFGNSVDLSSVTEVFLESLGTNGFAPTDIELAPDGSVYLSVGGRGTTGSVYKVSPIGKSKDARRIANEFNLRN